MTRIALIVGSLAKQSLNRAVAQHIAAQAPDGIRVEEVQIDDLPLYTQDRDSETVAPYERVREALKAADAVLIVSPEHNRAMPAAVKNLIDVASRPHGQSVWNGKKVAVVTASPGSYGGLSCGLQIRQSLQALGANVLVSPEVYLSRAHTAVENGAVTDERTERFLNNFAQAFYGWAA